MTDIVKINERFNKYINKLLNIAESSGGIDSCMNIIIKNNIKSLNKINPLLIMNILGKYLFDNSESIKNSDDAFLIRFTDKNYLKDKINEYQIPYNESDIDIIYNIVNSVYSKWEIYDDEQKKIIFKLFQILLSEYSKYLHITI